MLEELWRYWARKRATRVMPLRTDFLPYEIPQLLPLLSIIEREQSRIRVRLMGSAVVQAYGFDATGRFFDEVLSGLRLDRATRLASTAFETGAPMFASTSYLSAGGVPHRAERIALPLGDDSMRTAFILIGSVFDQPAKAGDPTVPFDGVEIVLL